MKSNKELRLAIAEMQDGDLQHRSEQLLEWLKFEKKETFAEMINFAGLQAELIDNLTRELADLRKEQREPEKKFFPMSTPARKIRS
ncbi:hypothetical protein [Dyadobacter aurulentus]|uniref:hypothetical protein n=1 Tax=Dyadobacter sp. UC 10 TaxID=2605428 RepID=UPI0011F35BFB|nr:hypothetical protein [Dyadobacter sp. UC 10]KAA0992754.1 hypothetical protein FXO21_22545 [Dyadobacter sp. UC 10]